MPGTATAHRAAGNLRGSKASCALARTMPHAGHRNHPCRFHAQSVPIGAAATDEQPEAEPRPDRRPVAFGRSGGLAPYPPAGRLRWSRSGFISRCRWRSARRRSRPACCGSALRPARRSGWWRRRAGWPERTWAVEGAGGLGHLLAQQLAVAGERVLDVRARLGARVRLLATGQTNKNDLDDALPVAVAAPRSKTRRQVSADDYAAVLKVWPAAPGPGPGQEPGRVPAPRGAASAG